MRTLSVRKGTTRTVSGSHSERSGSPSPCHTATPPVLLLLLPPDPCSPAAAASSFALLYYLVDSAQHVRCDWSLGTQAVSRGSVPPQAVGRLHGVPNGGHPKHHAARSERNGQILASSVLTSGPSCLGGWPAAGCDPSSRRKCCRWLVGLYSSAPLSSSMSSRNTIEHPFSHGIARPVRLIRMRPHAWMWGARGAPMYRLHLVQNGHGPGSSMTAATIATIRGCENTRASPWDNAAAGGHRHRDGQSQSLPAHWHQDPAAAQERCALAWRRGSLPPVLCETRRLARRSGRTAAAPRHHGRFMAPA